jgi:PAS domain S-box-containing protein
LRKEDLLRKFKRAQKKIEVLENMIEDRTGYLYLANEELRESRDFVQTVIDSIADPILGIEPENYHIISANKAAKELVGGEDPVARGMTCYQVSHHRDSPCEGPDDTCPMIQVMDTKSPVRVTHTHYDADKNESIVDIIATPVFDRDGKVAQVIESCRDITELKRMEEEPKRYTLELEGTNEELTAINEELMASKDEIERRSRAVERMTHAMSMLVEDVSELNDDLKKTQAELEEANSLKDLFTDIMRHDLLNPVGVIKGAADLLQGGETTDPAMADMIQRSAAKLEDMIQSASRYAKVQSVEELEKGEEDLAAIIGSVVEDFLPYLEEKGMSVEFTPVREAKALVNPMIEDVFANLISNAIKYSPENTIITLDIAGEERGWRISVKDQGDGIPDKYKEEIFERFKKREKGGVKGTGLGLAIVKRIVDLHGGRIWVEDNPEGGSIFYVRLPNRQAGGETVRAAH